MQTNPQKPTQFMVSYLLSPYSGKNYFIICFLLLSNLCDAQLANSNYGLKSKMGVTMNHEFTQGTFDSFSLSQHYTNLQVSLPLFLKIDSTFIKPKIAIVQVEYTFRKTDNLFKQAEQALLPTNLYANALSISYVHTIAYPFFMNYAAQLIYAGDYAHLMPLHINASTFFLYRVNERLIVGAGILYQQTGNQQRNFLIGPYLDWRTNNQWFVDVVFPDRILFGKNLGNRKITQMALGVYLEFFTRYSLNSQDTSRIYENLEISSGIDFRTQIHKHFFLNVFIGNNFYKELRLRDDRFDPITSINTSLGLNIKLGLSLNLE